MHFVEGGVLCSGRGEGIRRVSSLQGVLCLSEGTISHTGKNDNRKRGENRVYVGTQRRKKLAALCSCPTMHPACMHVLPQSSHFTDEKVEVWRGEVICV